MPMELSHLMQLVAGQRSSIVVGDLPRPVAEYLRCNPAIVFLGHRECLKIVSKHSTIKADHLQYLPMALKHGRYFEDKERPRCVTIFFDNPLDQEQYLIGLKAVDRGTEVWVQTYYRTNQKAKARKVARATQIL